MYQREVQAGVSLLNQKQPGWVKSIRLADFDMKDSQESSDVLEQVFGSYEAGIKSLGISYMDADQYGFCLRTKAENYDLAMSRFAYEDLTAAWVAAIRVESEKLQQAGR